MTYIGIEYIRFIFQLKRRTLFYISFYWEIWDRISRYLITTFLIILEINDLKFI